MNNVQSCANLLSDRAQCDFQMRRALDAYPISAQQHLSKPTGRRPWIGAAACNVAIGANEEEVRIAWNFYMTTAQQDQANAVADEVISHWEGANA